MVEVPIKDMTSDANIIGSHFVYKVKVSTEDVEGVPSRVMKHKSSLCVQGNKDAEREALRTDAAVVSHMFFSIIICHCLRKGDDHW